MTFLFNAKIEKIFYFIGCRSTINNITNMGIIDKAIWEKY